MKTRNTHRPRKTTTAKKRKYTIHIPKVIVQTSKKRPPQSIIDALMSYCKGWKYEHYTDKQITKFFHDNYIHEFKDIHTKIKNMSSGAHKADVFRYYYLYVNGGVYIDTDAMLERDIDTIVKDNSFFSVNSITPKTIFQGLLGAVPKNLIIYRALQDAYTIHPAKLKSYYHVLTRNLYTIIKDNKYDFKYTLYQERLDTPKSAISYDGNDKILTHYFGDKEYSNWDMLNTNIQ